MAKAAPAEQLRLLDVAQLDSQITKLKRSITEASKDSDLDAAVAQHAESAAALTEVSARLSAATQGLKESELAVEKVVAHINKDQDRIDRNAGSASDMMALSHEIETLTVRRNELEDHELELMGELEEIQAEHDAASAFLATHAEEVANHTARRDASVATLTRELAATENTRKDLAATFDEVLIGAYERVRSRGGIGAARLFHGTSEASGIALAAGDLAEIRAAAADDIVYCPDSGAILVRNSEWGS
ncbi:DNA-binding protein [Arthrobacter sp. MYb227]|uniref:zinc ribbon domain-containing protein n=1 Tax=Arthrobacter sp. MYb227 TaxID=1848601 RepID=UPI000CFD537D|nr:DNA-binding protein [Arthrobacter sp. MYb227]PQZ87324.1 DNA-binding protein [Arthrobacter sp. MYb227]